MRSEADITLPQKRGRREIATILFADIVDSTSHILNRDEEAAEQILDQAIEAIRTCIHSYGGAIARIQGDGVMAVFGAPQFMEDHVERACHAACDIRDSFLAAESGLRVRIGLHSGHILTRLQKADFGTVFDVVGVAVNIAGKAEGRAMPNNVVVTDAVLALLTKQAAIEPLAPLELPDSEPISLYALAELAEPPGDKLVELSSVPLAGREAEIERLAALWQSPQSDQPRTVGLLGDAGIGKSRLAAEVAVLARKRGRKIISLYGLGILQATPFGALKPLLAQLLELKHASENAPDLAGSFRVVEDWLRASERSENRIVTPRALADAVVELFCAFVETQTLLWIIEDIQDFDPESWDWIKALMKRLRPVAIPTIITARPHHDRQLPPICDHVIQLQPLSETATRNLAERIVRPENASALTIDEIVRRSDGVPFFVKELARMAHAVAPQNASDETVPLTVENLIAARLNALSRGAEQFVLSASILGTEFEISRARALVDPSLPFSLDEIVNELVAQQVIKRGSRGQLRFSHQIYADVARGRLLPSRRRQLHALAAASFGAVGDAIPENAEQTAYHYQAAGDLDAAVRFQLKACKFAVARSANHSVMDLFRRGFLLRERIGREAQRDLCDLILASVDSLLQLGQTALLIEALNYVIAFGESADNARRTALARGNLAFLYWFLGQQKSAHEQAIAAHAIPIDGQDLPVRSVTLFAQAVVHHARGDLRSAVDTHQTLIDVLTDQPDEARYGASLFPIVRSRAFKAWSLCELGELENAIQECALAEGNLGTITQPYSRLLILAARGKAQNGLGDYAAAERALLESRDICFREQQWGMEPCISAWLAIALFGQGRAEEALEIAKKSYTTQLYRAGGPAAQCELLYALSDIAIQTQNLDLAEDALATGRDIAQRSDEIVGTAYMMFAAAKYNAVTASASALIQEQFQASIDFAATYKLLPLIADGLLALANTTEQLGDISLAAAQREEAAKLRAQCGISR